MLPTLIHHFAAGVLQNHSNNETEIERKKLIDFERSCFVLLMCFKVLSSFCRFTEISVFKKLCIYIYFKLRRPQLFKKSNESTNLHKVDTVRVLLQSQKIITHI